MVAQLIEIAGWCGAGLLLLGYGLVSRKKITGDSATYQYMNMVGACLLLLNSGYHGALPPAALNLVWMGIAIWTLCKKSRTSSHPDKS